MPTRSQPPTRRVGPVARRRDDSPAGPRGRAPPKAALQLAIGRDGIGLELAEPVDVACLRVLELSTSLTGVRFPVDVSGGVMRFRHRRGQLHVLRVEVSARALERWVAPMLRGLVDTRAPDVWIEFGRARATVCVAALLDGDEPAARAAPVLAFEVHALAEGEDLVLVVANARGAGLPESATAIAIGCVDAAIGRVANRTGAVFALGRPADALARILLPGVGARVPRTDGVCWAALGADGGTWVLHAALGADPATPTEHALRAREVATMLVEGDEALLRGDSIGARTHYLEALERAPRHIEIAARIMEIDARVPGRAEAALAALAELRMRGNDVGFGVVPGELLVQVGDVDAALASFERAAEGERAPALAARAFELAASATRDVEAASRWLDRALACAPRSTTARWARVEARLALGRLEDAVADVEHLEALARGARGKYAVWLRAGRAWDAAGARVQAGPIFERALRFAPDEPEALAGLGAALVGDGRAARGVSLLARALDRARSRGQPEAPILLELAKALAERLDDLPAAIAHVAGVPSDAAEAPMARGLEGRWRASLGDFAGAALAFARLRDLAASLMPRANDARARPIVDLLLEAAAVERRSRRDPLAAQRHLAVALRLVPDHPAARRAYREVGTLVLRAAGTDGDATEIIQPHEDADGSPTPDPPRMPWAIDLALSPETAAEGDQAARADELTRLLQAHPSDEAVFEELMTLLEQLDRGHEIVALLTGRLEDASPEYRAMLAPRARAIFVRMAARAETAGRADDATLYLDALERVP
jgi:tetratricopeptide (TPR) repeat protein